MTLWKTVCSIRSVVMVSDEINLLFHFWISIENFLFPLIDRNHFIVLLLKDGKSERHPLKQNLLLDQLLLFLHFCTLFFFTYWSNKFFPPILTIHSALFSLHYFQEIVKKAFLVFESLNQSDNQDTEFTPV